MSQPSETKQSIKSGRMVLHPSHKLDKSSAFFKNTRVSSCSYVRMNQGNPEVLFFI